MRFTVWVKKLWRVFLSQSIFFPFLFWIGSLWLMKLQNNTNSNRKIACAVIYWRWKSTVERGSSNISLFLIICRSEFCHFCFLKPLFPILPVIIHVCDRMGCFFVHAVNGDCVPIWIWPWDVERVDATCFAEHVLGCVRTESVYRQVIFARYKLEIVFRHDKVMVLLHCADAAVAPKYSQIFGSEDLKLDLFAVAGSDIFHKILDFILLLAIGAH